MWFATYYMKLDPRTQEKHKFIGEDIWGISEEHARQELQEKGLGHYAVDGVRVSRIPAVNDNEPDFSRKVDYYEYLYN